MNTQPQTSSSSLHRLQNMLTTFFSWFSQKGYAQGAFWVLMITVVSATNDVFMVKLGKRLDITEISFFRFFFSLVTVMPILLYKGTHLLRTSHMNMHIMRGVIGAIALGLCCFAVNNMPMSVNTTIMFTQPLFFLPLAYFFLKEQVDKYRWLATLVGFAGILIVMQPGTDAFQMQAFSPLLAALLFAIISIMAKQMISSEHSITLLFYFGLVTSIVSFPVMLPFWQTPNLNELFMLCLLGIGANLIQVCIFKAFSAADASAITPVFYTEIGISTFFGFFFFDQHPTLAVLFGASLIIASTFAISVIERRREQTKQKVVAQ